MRKFLSGMVVVSVLKLIFYAISTAIKLIANIMVFFGLYVPFFILYSAKCYCCLRDFRLRPIIQMSDYLYSIGAFLFLFCYNYC